MRVQTRSKAISKDHRNSRVVLLKARVLVTRRTGHPRGLPVLIKSCPISFGTKRDTSVKENRVSNTVTKPPSHLTQESISKSISIQQRVETLDHAECLRRVASIFKLGVPTVFLCLSILERVSRTETSDFEGLASHIG